MTEEKNTMKGHLYGFPPHLVPFIRCPVDNGEMAALSRANTPTGTILRGSLACRSCNRSFPIVNGIVQLLQTEELDEEGLYEVQYRDAQGMASEEEIEWFETKHSSRLEIPQHMAALNLKSEYVVLELACGRGRFTLRFEGKCRSVLAIDFSSSSLGTLSRRLGSGFEVGLVHGDITKVNLKPKSFHRVFSTTPLDSREERIAMHRLAADALRDDGIYVFSVEHYDLRTRLLGNPRLMRYPGGGSTFQRMASMEVETEAHPYFGEVLSRPIQIFLPFIKSVLLSRMIEFIPLLRQFGNLLLVRAAAPIRVPGMNQRTAGSRVFQLVYRWLNLPDKTP